MDVDQLKARVAAARRFDHTVDGVRFSLELPTEHALRVHTARARAGAALDTGTLMVLVSRAMLIEALRGLGWRDGGALPVGGRARGGGVRCFAGGRPGRRAADVGGAAGQRAV